MAFEKIQQKPRSYRRRVLFWTVGVLMVLVIGGWILFLRGTSYGNIDRPGFIQNIRNIGDAVNESFSGVSDSVNTYRERREEQKQEVDQLEQAPEEAQNTPAE